MKTTLLSVACALLTVAAANAQSSTTSSTTTSSLDGSSTTTSTTTTGSGTITEYSPGSSFIVKEESGPVHYRYGDKVTYYGHGHEMKEEDVKTRIKIGAPVHVHYRKDGENRVISRIDVDD